MSAEPDHVAVEAVLAGLEAAWNAADGDRFAGHFDEDADFVTIHGLHAQGRDTTSIESVVEGLTRTWNEGDAQAFAEFLAEEADLVNIYGLHLRGRQAIAGMYDMLFRSVFSSSSVTATISSMRPLRQNVALVH